MIAVVLITTFELPPAKISPATCFDSASLSAAIRNASPSALRPMELATSSARLEDSAVVTASRSRSGRDATAALRMPASTVLLVCAASGDARLIAANAASKERDLWYDTKAPLLVCLHGYGARRVPGSGREVCTEHQKHSSCRKSAHWAITANFIDPSRPRLSHRGPVFTSACVCRSCRVLGNRGRRIRTGGVEAEG